jgi:hypothetical protein
VRSVTSRRLVALLVAAAAAAAVVLLNVVLLGSASARNNPVGTLSPKASLPPAPRWAIRPISGRPHDRRADD